jgi:hypothetical protein
MDKHARTADGTPTTSITSILLHCEATLRALHGQGALTSEALKVFEDLAERIRRSVDRRGGLDRRAHPRTSRDRRRVLFWRPQLKVPSVPASETLGTIHVGLRTNRDEASTALITTTKDSP